MAAADDDNDEYKYSKATIARLEAEIRQLREENRAASSERDSLHRDLDSKQAEEIQNLYKEILQTEKAHEEARLELREEKKARYSIEEAHRELERRIDHLNDEFTSIILSAVAAQGDLEERFERKARALQFLSDKVLRMLQWTRETVCGEREGAKGDPVDEGEEVDDEGLKTMIEPFVSEVEKIRLGLLKRGIGSHQTKTTLCWF